jgi:GNAT superfamily N-acetyltransferase
MGVIRDTLGAVGYALDTPGAYTRGLLAGRPGQRVGGREMLQDWGVVGENRPGLDWGDAAGFGAEMLLDPLNAIGLGLIGRTAKLAPKMVQASTKAALPAVPEAALTALTFPGKTGATRAVTRVKKAGATKGRVVSTPGADTARTARSMFKDAPIGDAPVHRTNEIYLKPSMRGQGVGQQAYLAHAANNPQAWHYNSQIEPAARNSLEQLADRGLIDLNWRGDMHLWKPTQSGLDEAAQFMAPPANYAAELPMVPYEELMQAAVRPRSQKGVIAAALAGHNALRAYQ